MNQVRLSPKEEEAIKHLYAGLTAKEVQQKLDIEETTYRTLTKRIRVKYGVQTTMQAVVRYGLERRGNSVEHLKKEEERLRELLDRLEDGVNRIEHLLVKYRR